MLNGYALRHGPPSPEEAREVRTQAGLSPKSLEQTTLSLAGSWAAAHVVDDHGQVVGIGRVIGDGGWYFHIVDMAVLPNHQRRGIGDAILTALLDRISADAPASAYVTLLADTPGRPLYRRHGFVETAPDTVGMRLPSQAAGPGSSPGLPGSPRTATPHWRCVRRCWRRRKRCLRPAQAGRWCAVPSSDDSQAGHIDAAGTRCHTRWS